MFCWLLIVGKGETEKEDRGMKEKRKGERKKEDKRHGREYICEFLVSAIPPGLFFKGSPCALICPTDLVIHLVLGLLTTPEIRISNRFS